MKRNEFIKSLGLLSVASAVGANMISCSGKSTSESATDTISVAKTKPNDLFFKISLAEWSIHNTLYANKLTNLDFPAKAKNDFGISAVEYVNQFFMDKAKDQSYLKELKKRCDDNGVTSVLIMIDSEGYLGDTNKKARDLTVENHKKWVEAAKFLGCHSIRVNAYGEGTREEVAKAATEGLRLLSEFAKSFDLNVIVENHGSYSSDGQWLTKVIKDTTMSNCGTLPDFGNFCIKNDQAGKCIEEYDRYKGVEEMMPFAKGVSAKSMQFDANGNCVETDYYKMLPIVKKAGYTGHIGIEYSADDIISEDDGIRKTKTLLEKAGAAIS
jgi:sugar phosphate isomerase/epimerase